MPITDIILFILWLLAVLGLLGALVTVFVRSHRKAKAKQFLSSDEVCGALVARNGAKKGQIFPIPKEGLVLGRDPALADVVIEDNTGVSRRHARVFVAGGRIVVVDMGAKNGTYVNGKHIGQKELMHGDTISLGRRQPSMFQFLGKPT